VAVRLSHAAATGFWSGPNKFRFWMNQKPDHNLQRVPVRFFGLGPTRRQDKIHERRCSLLACVHIAIIYLH
jgi:hypothetical protein